MKEKYDNKLEKEMTGKEYEIISRIMKALVNRKITVPGSYVGYVLTNTRKCFTYARTIAHSV